jgi:RNA polymerase sigma-70 factor (ECF subfamily)
VGDTGGGSAGGRFATTSWSLVVAAGETSEPGANEALEALCRAYWRPVYAYLRRHGARADEAGDLTQGFFTGVIEKRWLKHARRERGRFRTFLLTSVRNYAADERERASALKRGGGRAAIPLDAADAERSYALEPVDAETPATIFERKWARELIDRCLLRLEHESRPADPQRFDRLRPLLTGDSAERYRALAEELGAGESALRVAVHRLRRRFGEILREEVAATVGDPAEVEAELRHLLAVLRP